MTWTNFSYLAGFLLSIISYTYATYIPVFSASTYEKGDNVPLLVDTLSPTPGINHILESIVSYDCRKHKFV